MPAKKVTSKKAAGLSVPVYTIAGAQSGSLDLPKEVFGEEVNNGLLVQAARVYQNAQKGHWSHTKTRGEVTGTTAKMYKQKHTGRARHGAAKAPLFVGGGIALGPKSRKVNLELPKKMKNKALISALSHKLAASEVLGLEGIEKLTGKTKQAAALALKLGKKSLLVVADKNIEKASLALRNIPKVSFLPADQINAFEVIKHQSVILTKEAVEKLQQRLSKKEKGVSKI